MVQKTWDKICKFQKLVIWALKNDKNNRKIILLAFLFAFHVEVKTIKEKFTFQKCLQSVFEMITIHKAKNVYPNKILYLYQEYCKEHLHCLPILCMLVGLKMNNNKQFTLTLTSDY